MNRKNCFIPSEKIKFYLLNPEGKHFHEFFDVGYSEYTCKSLKIDLENQFNMDNSCDYRESYDGAITFSVFMMLGIMKKRRFRTVWQLDYPNAVPRLITAYREDE